MCWKNKHFYGYNSSYKTYFANTILKGFEKNNSTILQINGIDASKMDYEVFFINSKNVIEDNFKYNSKSLIKQVYSEKINELIQSKDIYNILEEKLSSTNIELAKLFPELDNEIKISLNDNVHSFIDDHINVSSYNPLSSSKSKLILTNILLENFKKTHKHKIIIWDDFDLYFDESSTMSLIEKISKTSNCSFFLFTSKIYSLPYVIGKFNIFNIRENKIIDFSNIYELIENSFVNNLEENKSVSFDEYLVKKNFFLTKSETNMILKIIKSNSIFNFERMLVNKFYNFENHNNEVPTIYINSEEEKIFLKYIDKIIMSE